MILEIAVDILGILAMVFFSVCILLLIRDMRRHFADDNEKPSTVPDKNRVPRRVRRINRLTNQSKNWLEARGKSGKG